MLPWTVLVHHLWVEKLAIRAFTLAAVTSAGITGALGAIALPNGSGSMIALIVFLVVASAPAALAWARPTRASLAAWATFAWLAAFAYGISGWPHPRELQSPMWAGAEVALIVTLVLELGATIVLAFAVAAVEHHRAGPPPASPLTRRLRRVVHLAVITAAIASVCAFLPGSRVYSDSNDCMGEALGSLASTETRHHQCTPRYDHLKAARPAGGAPLAIGLVMLLAPGMLVWANPRKRNAVVWAVWTVPVLGVTALAALFHMDLFDHTVVLWPEHVVGWCLGVLLTLLSIGLPVIALVTHGTTDTVARASYRTP
jgi:hypothetical protein